MASPLSRYAFLNAKLKARISKITSDEKIDQLLKAKSLPEAVQLLKGTEFEPLEKAYVETGDLRMGEYVLYVREIELYTELQRFVEEPVLQFIRALSLRYEGDNLKKALRLWFDKTVRKRTLEGATGYIYRKTIVHRFDIDEVIAAADLPTLHKALAGTPYSDFIAQWGREIELQKSLFSLEIEIDKYFYRELFSSLERLPKQDRQIAKTMATLEIDMQNIDWLIRFKNYYNLPLEKALPLLIPYGNFKDLASISSSYTSGSISEILSELLKKHYSKWQTLLGKGSDSVSRLTLMERVLKQITLAQVEKLLGGYPFNIGIVLAYFFLKRNEMQTIMTILNAKYYNLPEERIKSVL